jgi:hypothetical protein
MSSEVETSLTVSSVIVESSVNSECDATIGPVRDVSTPLDMTDFARHDKRSQSLIR